jgi:flagellar biosynthetic protein FliQ
VEQGDIIRIVHAGILQILWLALPMLGLGLIVGLVISIIQATTQINEQTIVFVAKILSVFVALIIFGSWMLQSLHEYTIGVYDNILEILRRR